MRAQQNQQLFRHSRTYDTYRIHTHIYVEPEQLTLTLFLYNFIILLFHFGLFLHVLSPRRFRFQFTPFILSDKSELNV